MVGQIFDGKGLFRDFHLDSTTGNAELPESGEQ